MKTSLDILRVIDRLEVGPVRLEPRRLTVTYRVVQGKRSDTIDLIFRYEDDVFIPDEPESLNLAGMIAAQPALNYGLFCSEIVFQGRYDQIDRRFISDASRNTAREIYVKKFLEPNPFLRGDAARLGVVKKKDYCTAGFLFPEAETGTAVTAVSKRGWGEGREKHAVLSSGGKDSLLSFGMLREIGCDTHPIFINESGRHWFTALNAYRWFSRNIKNTARVWTNVDRLFNWMLRHLPFIRTDFNRVRADIYPIRLWTVAVFLFSALPVLRKQGINRLIIGDEYDSTRRVSYKGIPHYDGIYDQSRYFDNYLSRYFHRKGWRVSQFSVLRPLSELLIEKILVERYPKLQEQQMSCHSSHKKGGRILPCGRCEKCRRIVAMLAALGAGPKHCGYSTEQIEGCLKAFATKGVKQEDDSIEHLFCLLGKQGIFNTQAQPRPEIMKLKFDSERSPFECIPSELREPLYRICLEHSEGAVKRSGRMWIDFDLLHDPEINTPYPYEARIVGSTGKDQTDSRPSYELCTLTWLEAKKRFKEVDTALLPVGSIEQHGPHLPLDTDAFDAAHLAYKVAEACSDPKPLVLPLIPYGVSYHHLDFSGTISISPETLSQLVIEVGMSAARHGITKLVKINGHGGKAPALSYAAQVTNRDAHFFTCVDTGESSDAGVEELADTPNDVHAGEIETSTSLSIRPELVRTEAIKKFVPRFSSRYLNFSSKRGVNWYAYTSKISSTGVMGDPTKATAEKGRRMWDAMIKHLVAFVEDLKRLSLDELYQRRY